MAYLIDTDICIHARDGTDAVLDKLAEHDGEVLLSALSLAELQRGLHRDPAFTALRQARLEVLLRSIPSCRLMTLLLRFMAGSSPNAVGRRDGITTA